jgi:hypothetical protein
MSRNILSALVIAPIVLALTAAAAVAQSNVWTHPGGLIRVDLAPGIEPIPNEILNPKQTTFRVRDPATGEAVGLCVLMVPARGEVVAPDVWAQHITGLQSPEMASKLASSQGYKLLRLVSTRQFTSRAGYAGFVQVIERERNESGARQTAVFGVTALAPGQQMFAQCNTTLARPDGFTSARIDSVFRFIGSARLP